MGRILAIDYGKKRCGVAVTDTLKISANGLPTLETPRLLAWVKEYVGKEPVERILIGEPRQTNGLPSENMRYITPFVNRLKKELPEMPVEMVDERFTSVIAHREMLAAGFKKSDRQRKGLADEMSAVIILTSWLDSHSI
ncbi:MAG: Holliday junction resolvase RuvX [Muribaculaceae bacterium]|nr:Holliday junction resolvase RuvX [Muribaculaceae bacterium]